MAEETLHPNTDIPGGSSNDGHTINTGVVFSAAVPGVVLRHRAYVPAVVSTYTGRLYLTSTMAMLGEVVYPVGTGIAGGWIEAAFSSPIALTPGVSYTTVLYSTEGTYVFQGGFPHASGNLTSTASGFLYDVIGYPTNATTVDFFTDIVFEPNADANVSPDSTVLTLTLGEPTVDLEQDVTPDSLLLPIAFGNPSVSGAASEGRFDLVPALFEKALECLCDGTAGNPNPPALCVPRVGTEIVFDLGQYQDLCCEGISYIALGDMYISSTSFPEQDIVQQIRGQCAPPTWAVDFKLGIIRCISAGQPNGDPPTEASQLEAARQNIYDAQSLRYASCCFRNWLSVQYGTLYDGMNVVINRQVQTNPQGGCVERYVTLTVQFPDIDCGCP